jgi:hypothetical protein
VLLSAFNGTAVAYLSWLRDICRFYLSTGAVSRLPAGFGAEACIRVAAMLQWGWDTQLMYGLTYLSRHGRPTADKQLSNGAAGLLSVASKSRKSNPAGRSKEALHSVDRFVPDR